MVQIVSIKAPVTGIVDIKVDEGASVEKGVLLAVQSAQKTETQISSPVSGRVKTVTSKGASLNAGDVIAEIEF
jgi:pyruvate carboxylase